MGGGPAVAGSYGTGGGAGRGPLIGISSYQEETVAWSVWRQPACLIPQTYVDAVTRAGATAVLLPPQPAGAEDIVRVLDGLVLSGGPDIDPGRYGAAAGPDTGPSQPRRDAWELALLRAALDRDLPLLAVCRGLQLLNVGLGGTLDQHLPDGGHRIVPGRFVRRAVRVRPDSLLAAAVGGSADVSCYHHQAVAVLADALVPTGWAADGTVEAAELPGHRFVLGVQWHPETDPDDPRLFQALATASRKGPAR